LGSIGLSIASIAFFPSPRRGKEECPTGYTGECAAKLGTFIGELWITFGDAHARRKQTGRFSHSDDDVAKRHIERFD